jgi:hypothetical protein
VQLLCDQDNPGPIHLKDKNPYHPQNHVRALIDIAEEAASLDKEAAPLMEGREAAALEEGEDAATFAGRYADNVNLLVAVSAYLEDPDILSSVQQMMSPICKTCTHPECKLINLHTRNIGHLAQRIGLDRLQYIKWASNGNLLFNKATYVPNVDNLHASILALWHDATFGGHNGGAKLEITSRDYYGLGMRADIQRYVQDVLYVRGQRHLGKSRMVISRPLNFRKVLGNTSPWTSLNCYLPQTDSILYLSLSIDLQSGLSFSQQPHA